MAEREITVRDATDADWAEIWTFMRRIVAAGETYAYDRELPESDARERWLEAPMHTLVATDERSAVVGTAITGPNREGPGAHVATASFMVDPEQSGHGAGRALAERVIEIARANGFHAMQFNAVVETNAVAVALWQSLGFEIVGTVPESFDHPAHGLVGLHVMYRTL